MSWELISLPVIAAFIGWGTNVIAIKMLFWPRRPVKIGGWNFWGVLPKRQKEIAASIGQVISEDLLPGSDLLKAVNTRQTRQEVTELISKNLEAKLNRFLPFFIPESARKKIKEHLRGQVGEEIDTLFAQLETTVSGRFQAEGLLSDLVEEKINSFDFLQLENLVLKVAKKELRHIEFFGALLGFLIGLIQVLILFFLKATPG